MTTTSTPPLAYRTRKPALGACCTAALLALSACGGGGDDTPPTTPTEAKASDCYGALLGQQQHFRQVNRVTSAIPATREVEWTKGEIVDFNGRRVRRDSQISIDTYPATAPADYAGHTYTYVAQSYYDLNPDFSQTLYANATASRWDDWAPNEQETFVQIYLEPYPLDRQFALQPGETASITHKRTWRRQAQDGTVTTGTDAPTSSATYHGQETVTVPAGSFTACRMSYESGLIAWFAKDTGVVVKDDQPYPAGGRQISELTAYQPL